MIDFFKKASKGTLIVLIITLFFLVASVCQSLACGSSKAVCNAINVKNGKYDKANDNKEIVASGNPEIINNPVDKLTGVSAEGFALMRTVKMYQYDLSDDNVIKVFSSEQLKNIKGKNGERYDNPAFPVDLHNEIFLADVRFSGGLEISADYISSVTEDYPYFEPAITEINISDLQDFDNDFGFVSEGTSYYSGDSDYPKIGDIEITYSCIPVSALKELTVYGRQENGCIVSDGLSYASMTNRIVDANELRSIVVGSQEDLRNGFILFFVISFVILLIKLLKSKGSLKKTVLPIAAVLILVSAPYISAKADFGDYGGDYDFGGNDSFDFDFGGNDYDYDSGGDVAVVETTSSYYSYDGYPSDAVSIYDGSYGYRNTAGALVNVNKLKEVSSPYESGNYLSFFAAIAGIIAVLIAKKNKITHTARPLGAVRTSSAALNNINEYNQIDELFDRDELCDRISDMYVQFQHAWQNKDLKDLRPYFTDEYFAQCNLQLDNYIRNSQTNIIDDIKVENVVLVGWKQEGENDVIVASVQAVIRDYVIDDNTGNFVRGNKHKLRRMCYEWNLVRATGKKTGDSSIEEGICPHCGAPLTINAANQCEYCDSIIETEASDWAVSRIKAISQITIQ